MVFKCVDTRKDQFGDIQQYVLKDSTGNIFKLSKIETIGLMKHDGNTIINMSLTPDGSLIIGEDRVIKHAYKCINKYVDNKGVARSYILMNEIGETGEFPREMVLAMLQNPTNTIENLKLTSDGKIIFTTDKNNNTDIKLNYLGLHPSTQLALLLESFNKIIIDDLNTANKNGQFDTKIKHYLNAVSTGMNQEAYKEYICNSNSIKVTGVALGANREVLGYSIKNVGKNPVIYNESTFRIDTDTNKIIETSVGRKELLPGEETTMSRLNIIRIISSFSFGGIFNNAMLKYKKSKDIIGNKEMFMYKYCYLDTGQLKVLPNKVSKQLKQELKIGNNQKYDIFSIMFRR